MIIMFLLGMVVTIAVLIYWRRTPRHEDAKPVGRIRSFARVVLAKFWFAAQWGLFIAFTLGAVRVLLMSDELFDAPIGVDLGLIGPILMIFLVGIFGAFTYFALLFVISLIAWPAQAWKARKPKIGALDPDEKPAEPPAPET